MFGFSTSRRTVIAGGVAALATIGPSSRSRAQAQPYLPSSRKRRFDRERFIVDCVEAHRADGMEGVREILSSAISDHRAVLAGLGEPTEAGIVVMHSSPSFTIFAAHWTPQMNLLPHDHMMKALIGIYSGREDNILWRRQAPGIEAYKVNCLFEGEVASLPADAIHSVTNPLLRFTAGIHIYDGDFFGTDRHQWDPDTLVEAPSNGDSIRALFAQANERYRSSCAADRS